MSDRAYIKDEIIAIRNAILKDGADPEKQISAYVLSEDPIYITTIDNARQRIKALDRDLILKELITAYFENLQ